MTKTKKRKSDLRIFIQREQIRDKQKMERLEAENEYWRLREKNSVLINRWFALIWILLLTTGSIFIAVGYYSVGKHDGKKEASFSCFNYLCSRHNNNCAEWSGIRQVIDFCQEATTYKTYNKFSGKVWIELTKQN